MKRSRILSGEAMDQRVVGVEVRRMAREGRGVSTVACL